MTVERVIWRLAWFVGRVTCRNVQAQRGRSRGAAPSICNQQWALHRARAMLHGTLPQTHTHKLIQAPRMWRDPAPSDQTSVEAAAVGELAPVTGSTSRHWLTRTYQNHEAGSGFPLVGWCRTLRAPWRAPVFPPSCSCASPLTLLNSSNLVVLVWGDDDLRRLTSHQRGSPPPAATSRVGGVYRRAAPWNDTVLTFLATRSRIENCSSSRRLETQKSRVFVFFFLRWTILNISHCYIFNFTCSDYKLSQTHVCVSLLQQCGSLSCYWKSGRKPSSTLLVLTLLPVVCTANFFGSLWCQKSLFSSAQQLLIQTYIYIYICLYKIYNSLKIKK